ncbi:acetyl-CoA synthetase-like protein [Basidiobolus meristosporus CBS 931.73]|uniref:Acetyl-CoA synthetase-like protein n=1 Tax=Basidiobolus meristosporus CBS 931.73 TaxID=1314790 RepID=A0A1Y1YTV1_9FUNG|nr:acetyl-CoA synthetase-like protein [Basidiobolus meristosporus CBS 931.73]|eukprot:ORY00995.1 acetyl-CoA synthetase-like protein [Basidiobolus meristosporus CBS 931.73]
MALTFPFTEIEAHHEFPAAIRQQLAQLERELADGDITQKGYHKKRNQILLDYQRVRLSGNSGPNSGATRDTQRPFNIQTQPIYTSGSQVGPTSPGGLNSAGSSNYQYQYQYPQQYPYGAPPPPQQQYPSGVRASNEAPNYPDNHLSRNNSYPYPAATAVEHFQSAPYSKPYPPYDNYDPYGYDPNIPRPQYPPIQTATSGLPYGAEGNVDRRVQVNIIPHETVPAYPHPSEHRYSSGSGYSLPGETLQQPANPASPTSPTSYNLQTRSPNSGLDLNRLSQISGRSDNSTQSYSPHPTQQYSTDFASNASAAPGNYHYYDKANDSPPAMNQVVDGPGGASENPVFGNAYTSASPVSSGYPPHDTPPLHEKFDQMRLHSEESREFENICAEERSPKSEVDELPALPSMPRQIPFTLYDGDSNVSLDTFGTIPSVLRFRAAHTPRNVAYSVLDTKGKDIGAYTWEKLVGRAEKISQLLKSKSNIRKGDRIGLVYRKSEFLDYISALFACFFVGAVAVPIVNTDSLAEVVFILKTTRTALVLSTELNIKALTRDLQNHRDEWPTSLEWIKTNDLGSLHRKQNYSEKNSPIEPTDLAYIEYSKSPNGELKGVGISHMTIMAQCAAFKAAAKCSGDTLVNAIEPRMQVGLVLTAFIGIYCGNYTVCVSSSTALEIPGLWMGCMTRYRATIGVADYTGLATVISSFRKENDNSLSYNKKQEFEFSNLRLLLIDTFNVDPYFNTEIAEFLLTPFGCRYPQRVITPMCSLPEHGGMILSFRDYLPKNTQSQAEEGERDVWNCLIDRDALRANTLKILDTCQDNFSRWDPKDTLWVEPFGYAMPQATIAIVDPDTKVLCAPNVIGEVWIDSPALSGGFWALPKLTRSIFHAQPLYFSSREEVPKPIEQEFLRTGLMGTLVNGKLVIFGLYEQRIRQKVYDSMITEGSNTRSISVVKYKYHYTPDMINTIKTYIDAIDVCAIFNHYANEENLPVLVLESNLPKEQYTAFLERLHQFVLDFYQLNLYCIAVCLPSTLPRSLRNGKYTINTELCRKHFRNGKLRIAMLKFSPLTPWDLDTNMENPANPKVPQCTRLEPIFNVIDERTGTDLVQFQNITDILIWRSSMTPEDRAFVTLDLKGREVKSITFRKLNGKISSLAYYLIEKRGLKSGDYVILIFPHGLDFIVAVHACLVCGLIPIPLAQPDVTRLHEDFVELVEVIQEFRVKSILVNTTTEELMSGKQVQSYLRSYYPNLRFPYIFNTTKAPKTSKMLGQDGSFKGREQWLQPNSTALILSYMSPDMKRTSVRLTHHAVIAHCQLQKSIFQMISGRPLISCARTFNGFGFMQATMMGIFVAPVTPGKLRLPLFQGCTSLLIAPPDFFSNPQVWFEVVYKYKVKDAFATTPMLQHAMAYMGSGDYKTFSLSQVHNLLIPSEGRPSPEIHESVVKAFLANRLEHSAVVTLYGTSANPMVSTRSYLKSEPLQIFLDPKSLRRGKVVVVEESDSPFSIMLHDSGKVPRNTLVAIVNPVTRKICYSGEIGEIWVSSECNGRGGSDAVNAERYMVHIENGDPEMNYVRTGDLGFLYADPNQSEDDPLLFVLGSIDDTFDVNDLTHYPIDVENTIEKSHELIIPEGSLSSIVFKTLDEEVVAVIQIQQSYEHLALGLIPLIVDAILDEHQFLIDTIVFVRDDALPRSRLNEKQRQQAMRKYTSGSLPYIISQRINERKIADSLPDGYPADQTGYAASNFGYTPSM